MRYGDCFSGADHDKMFSQERNYSALPVASLFQDLARALHLQSPVTSYTLRHSWATTAKYRGVPIEMISESLGHKSIKTTQTYLKGFGLKKRTEANQLNCFYVENYLTGK